MAEIGEVGEVDDANVYLLSQLGLHVYEFLMSNAVVRVKVKQLRGKVEKKIYEVVNRSFSGVHKVTRDILDGKISLF